VAAIGTFAVSACLIVHRAIDVRAVAGWAFSRVLGHFVFERIGTVVIDAPANLAPTPARQAAMFRAPLFYYRCFAHPATSYPGTVLV
jgi:hypothetical protein